VAAAGSNQDEEQLRLLEIFHYVLAGLEALTGLIPIVHVGMGIAMLTGYFPMPPAHGTPFPGMMGWFFVGIGATIILFSETLAVLTLLAGRSINKRKNRMFVLIVAGVNCLNVPMGTALGVFVFIVLSRPGVKALFDLEFVPESGRG
jgi:hypothetical protein